MPTRNHDIKPRRFPACPASLMARVSVAPARSPSHHVGAAPDRSIASRLRVAAQQRGQRCRHRSPQLTDRCASASLNGALPGRRSNTIAARACPTLLVTGGLTASDETIEQFGLHVSERVESVSRALVHRPGCRRPDRRGLVVAYGSGDSIRVAGAGTPCPRGRDHLCVRQRAGPLVDPPCRVPPVSLGRRTYRPNIRPDPVATIRRRHARSEADGERPYVAVSPGRRRLRPPTPVGSSCGIRTGSPVTLPGRHARPRARR